VKGRNNRDIIKSRACRISDKSSLAYVFYVKPSMAPLLPQTLLKVTPKCSIFSGVVRSKLGKLNFLNSQRVVRENRTVVGRAWRYSNTNDALLGL
jgi:hypothetical protein